MAASEKRAKRATRSAEANEWTRRTKPAASQKDGGEREHRTGSRDRAVRHAVARGHQKKQQAAEGERGDGEAAGEPRGFLLEKPGEARRGEDRQRRDRREYVGRELRLRDREEGDGKERREEQESPGRVGLNRTRRMSPAKEAPRLGHRRDEPGEGAEKDDGDHRPGGLGPVVNRGRVALEVLVDEEEPGEAGVAPLDQDEPGGGDSERHRRREDGAEGEEVAPAARVDEPPEPDRGGAEDERHRPLRQGTEGEGEAEADRLGARELPSGRGAPAPLGQDEKGGGRSEGENGVDRDDPGEGPDQERGEVEGGGQEPGEATTGETAPAEEDEKRRREGDEVGRKARRRRGWAQQLDRGGPEPVEHRRLFEVADPVEPRGDPVAGASHRGRDVGVAPLVRLDERKVSRPGEERREGRKEEGGEEDPLGEGEVSRPGLGEAQRPAPVSSSTQSR